MAQFRKERNKYKRLYFKYVENRDKVKKTDDQQNDMQNNNELNTQNNLDFNDFSTEDDDDTDFFFKIQMNTIITKKKTILNVLKKIMRLSLILF